MKKQNNTKTYGLKNHPMYTPSDLAYFHRKGYTDQEILAFWDRDMAMGLEPCHHKIPIDYISQLRQVAGKIIKTGRQTLFVGLHPQHPECQSQRIIDAAGGIASDKNVTVSAEALAELLYYISDMMED